MKNKGFTLIEILAIIAVLGIFMTVAIPSMVQSNKNAEEQKKITFENNVEDACEAFFNVNSENTSKINNICRDINDCTFDVIELVNEGYLSSTIKNPDTGEKLLAHQKNITATINGGNIKCELQQ